MRIVLDTNVLVSALLNPHGPPARVLDLVIIGEAVVIYDDRIRAEYAEVLARPRFGFAEADVAALLRSIEGWGEHVVAGPVEAEIPDPDDRAFVEVAIAGHAAAIVTGNTRHYAKVTTVRVVSPVEFLSLP